MRRKSVNYAVYKGEIWNGGDLLAVLKWVNTAGGIFGFEPGVTPF